MLPMRQKTFIGLLAGLFIVLAWRFLLVDGLIPLDGNMITLAYPNWAQARWFFEHHTLPLWNPWRDMGEPFLADPQTMVCYPILWILVALRDFHSFLAVWYITHTLLAAFFMAALAWRMYRNTPAAVLAGILAGFNGFFLSHLSPNVFASAAWMPAALYFSHRRSWVGLGTALGLQWLAGFPDFSLLTVLLACIPLLAEGKPGLWMVFRSGLLALGLAAMQFLPFLEYLSHSVRKLWVSPQTAVQFSISPLQLLIELFAPVWTLYNGLPQEDPAVTAFYVGLPAMGLAAWGIWKGTRQEKHWALATGACLLLSLGSYWPGFRSLRILHLFCYPAHWLLIASAGIALLAASGISQVKGRVRTWGWVGLVGIDLLIFAQLPRIGWLEPAFLTQRPALAEMLLKKPDPVRIYHTDAFIRAWHHQELRTAEQYFRFQTFLPPSYGMAFGVGDVRSHQVLCLKRAKAFHDRLALEGPHSPLVQAAGIGAVITMNRGASELDSGAVLLELPHPNPPLFLTPFRPKDRVEIRQLTPGLAEADVQAASSARLVFNQVSYPGWTVWIDGKRQAYELYEDTFLSVQVPAGRHAVRFHYESRLAKIGLGLTLLTVLFLLTLLKVGQI
jgi:hypothetical protein